MQAPFVHVVILLAGSWMNMNPSFECWSDASNKIQYLARILKSFFLSFRIGSALRIAVAQKTKNAHLNSLRAAKSPFCFPFFSSLQKYICWFHWTCRFSSFFFTFLFRHANAQAQRGAVVAGAKRKRNRLLNSGQKSQCMRVRWINK